MKKISTTKLLKEARETIAAMQAAATEMEKKLKSETSAKDSYYKLMNEAQNEIEQVHCLLDVLPATPGRKTEAPDQWQQKDVKLMTRLAAYLANRNMNTGETS